MRKQNINKIYNAAIYIRLSREDGDKEESNSVTNQKSMIQKYVNEHADLSLFDFYIDDGYTGTNFDRPGFRKMLEDIDKGHVNCVIVKDLSRFGRDHLDTGIYLEKDFVDRDIRFIAINDNVDSLKSQNDMIVPIKNLFNQQYAEDISRKVKSTINSKQKDGQFIGAFTSYGYKKDLKDKHKLVVDEYAADIVKRIFIMYADGVGKIRIANILNDEGILCPSEYKKKCGLNYKNSNKMDCTNYWTYSTIHNILKNQMYRGDMVQGKTHRRRVRGKVNYLPEKDWIVVKGTHPPIIDEVLWNRVHKSLQRDTRNIDFNKNISIFAGFLRCGDCGRAMSKNINVGRTHYVCATYKNYGTGKCTSHRVNQADLEGIILSDLNLIISSLKDLKGIVDQQKLKIINKSVIEKRISEFDNQLTKVASNKKASYTDYREGLITKKEYIDYRDDCDKKMDLLNRQKENLLKKTDKKDMDNPWIQNLLEKSRIEVLDKAILDEMIDMIYVYQDKSIKIIYNFSDELEVLLSKDEATNNKLA